MDKETQVLKMAKILCPKGTANCEKCSKNYKCDVKFSQLAELFDGGCQIVGENEIVIKQTDYVELNKDFYDWKKEYDHNCLLRLEVFELEKQLEKAKQEAVREVLQEFAERLKDRWSYRDRQKTVTLDDINETLEEFGGQQ